MKKIPTPDEFFDGQAPIDNITTEQYQEAVKGLQEFMGIASERINSLQDLGSLTFMIGEYIRRIVLSCGKLKIRELQYKVIEDEYTHDRKVIIPQRDTEYYERTDLEEKTLTTKSYKFEIESPEGTIISSSIQAKHFAPESKHVQRIHSYKLVEGKRINNYDIGIPINTEVDRMESEHSVIVRDFRDGKTEIFYPLSPEATVEGFRTYFEIAQEVCGGILNYLENNNLI